MRPWCLRTRSDETVLFCGEGELSRSRKIGTPWMRRVAGCSGNPGSGSEVSPGRLVAAVDWPGDQLPGGSPPRCPVVHRPGGDVAARVGALPADPWRLRQPSVPQAPGGADLAGQGRGQVRLQHLPTYSAETNPMERVCIRNAPALTIPKVWGYFPLATKIGRRPPNQRTSSSPSATNRTQTCLFVFRRGLPAARTFASKARSSTSSIIMPPGAILSVPRDLSDSLHVTATRTTVHAYTKRLEGQRFWLRPRYPKLVEQVFPS